MQNTCASLRGPCLSLSVSLSISFSPVSAHSKYPSRGFLPREMRTPGNDVRRFALSTSPPPPPLIRESSAGPSCLFGRPAGRRHHLPLLCLTTLQRFMFSTWRYSVQAFIPGRRELHSQNNRSGSRLRLRGICDTIRCCFHS